MEIHIKGLMHNGHRWNIVRIGDSYFARAGKSDTGPYSTVKYVVDTTTTKSVDGAVSDPSGTGAPELEITSEMIEAGIGAIKPFDLDEAAESQAACIDLISRVYRAMHRSHSRE
jgi:hypothetical protein